MLTQGPKNRKDKQEIRKLKPVALSKSCHQINNLRLVKKNENTRYAFFFSVLYSHLYVKTMELME